MTKPVTKRAFHITILILVSIGLYLPTLQNGFVYDDQFLILKNKWIRDFVYINDILFSSSWSFLKGEIADTYRPLQHLTYMLEYSIFGLQAWGYHLFNIVLHSINTVLVFFTASLLFNQLEGRGKDQETVHGSRFTVHYLPAFIAAILFATHPINTEAVAWATTVVELAMTALYLMSFYLYIISITDNFNLRSYILSILLFFLATLYKEPAITLPLILILYDFSKGNLKPILRNYKRYLPYFFIIAIYMGLRVNALGGLTAKSNIEIITLNNYQILINIFPLFFQYIWKLFFPVNLSAYYFFHPAYSIAEAKVLWGLFFTTIFFIILYLIKRKEHNFAFFCLSFILIPLLPTFYLRGLAGYAFAERYLYLPSVGFVILLSYIIKHGYGLLISKGDNRKWGTCCLATFLSLIIISYSTATILRNPAWQDDYTLWTDVVQKSPDNPAAHYSLGTIYKDRGEITEAIKEYETVLKLSSVYTKAKAHNNLGNIYSEEGSLDQAIYHYSRTLKINPTDAFTHNNLGLVYIRKGVWGEGITEYLKALQIKPDYPEAHYNLGLVYDENDMPDQAIAEYKKAIEVGIDLSLTNPAHLAVIHKNLGIAYINKDMLDKAAIQFEKALTITSDDADLHNRLGVIYAGKGALEKAVTHFQDAVRINPGHKGAQDNLKRAIIMKQKSNTSNQVP